MAIGIDEDIAYRYMCPQCGPKHLVFHNLGMSPMSRMMECTKCKKKGPEEDFCCRVPKGIDMREKQDFTLVWQRWRGDNPWMPPKPWACRESYSIMLDLIHGVNRPKFRKETG